MDFYGFDITSAFFWFLLGIFFLAVEITHYGFIFFFFGIGAFLTAIISWIGITNSITVQLIFFILTSLITLFVFRRKLSSVFKGKVTGKMKPGDDIDNIAGERAIVKVRIGPNSLNGKVEFHGTLWEAQSDYVIEKDSVVEIVGRDNLTLKVKPVE